MRGARTRTAAALLALALADPVLAEDPAPPPAPLVVADFEDPEAWEGIFAGAGVAVRVADDPEGKNHALRWTIDPGGESSFLTLRVPPSPGIAKARALRFRIRREGPTPGALFVRLESDRDDFLHARLRGVGPEWMTVALDLASLDAVGTFVPERTRAVEFIVFRPAAGTYLLDDVALEFAPPAPPEEPGAKGAKPPSKGPRRTVVADFEREGSEEYAESWRCGVARVPAGGKEKGSVLAWTLRKSERAAYLEIYGAPKSVRGFRKLRFRVRADRRIEQELTVRLEASIEVFLGAQVGGIDTAWKTVELSLPEMRGDSAFDPDRLGRVTFTLFEPLDATLHLDDIELEEAPGGWRFTPAEMTERVFGEDRVRKVKRIPTRHFDIQTDSTAASSKFPAALERAYDFVKKALGHAEMEEKLPVYIFQNPTLYVEFTVKSTGWTKEEAENTAGHGSGQYFATYYQAPDAPTVVHELTHSIFHRTVGAWGGSWLQEGVAVYIENGWQDRSAAEQFAPELRGGRFLKLREFTALESLVAEDDPKGGARTAGKLYLQAGAFYEFLRRGPLAKEAEKAVAALARTPATDAETPALVEKLFGRKLEDLEKEWIAWGSKPPKAK